MKAHVRVGTETFEVEVGELDARPIVAVVDGMRFEVWPEGDGSAGENGDAGPPGAAAPRADQGEHVPLAPRRAAAPCAPCLPGDRGWVCAPIPGRIDAAAVHPGDRVIRGQELLVLEAMKMKNSLRAPRAGTVTEVRVRAGQHVNRGDPLVHLAD